MIRKVQRRKKKSQCFHLLCVLRVRPRVCTKLPQWKFFVALLKSELCANQPSIARFILDDYAPHDSHTMPMQEVVEELRRSGQWIGMWQTYTELQVMTSSLPRSKQNKVFRLRNLDHLIRVCLLESLPIPNASSWVELQPLIDYMSTIKLIANHFDKVVSVISLIWAS